MTMASSLPSNHCTRQACLPFSNYNYQAKDNNMSKLEMKETEAFLASEMNRLSVQERSNALDDLHCVGEEVQETPDMIQKALADFDQAVRKEQNPFYEMAMNQNRAYVEDPTFRLKFLRAKLFNAREAVRKMMSLLECKAKYFGHGKVGREITLDDLSEEDKQLMLSGIYHIQDGRDRNGRLILHFFGKMLSRCKADNLIRIGYYIMYNILSSLPDVQRKGIVVIYNDTTLPEETFSMPGFHFIKELLAFYDSKAVRFSGIHYCLQTKGQNLELSNVIINLFLKGAPQETRVRTRIHYGSIIELQYQLQSYGIPLSTLPFGVQGNIRIDILNVWLHRHLEQTNQRICFLESEASHGWSQNMEVESDFGNHEQLLHSDANTDDVREALVLDLWHICDPMWASTEEDPGDTTHINSVPGSIEPTEMDVLFGKGYRLQLHPGNVFFREFLEQHRDEYESTPRQNRRAMAVELAQSLRNNGARFLQKAESGEWVESDNSQAEKKVSQFFRELRKKRSKAAGGR
ncbi:unnamed protein product [Cylindrotheca closterium]|uniref:DUF6824 domain-containing protein n=1 Tax=Cylindrotheca closterium TaxID=2856 RepID=A0AAD2JPI7_9STRA|nr:unnamed protein product [Cylindrotheca closterium]